MLKQSPGNFTTLVGRSHRLIEIRVVVFMEQLKRCKVVWGKFSGGSLRGYLCLFCLGKRAFRKGL